MEKDQRRGMKERMGGDQEGRKGRMVGDRGRGRMKRMGRNLRERRELVKIMWE